MRAGVVMVMLAVCLAGRGLAGWVVDGTPSVWQVWPAPAAAGDENTYPVFCLPMGGNWTDFELKADTNNFATSHKCYFVQSHKFSTSGYGDTNVWVHFTDSYAAESMQWRRATNGLAILDQVANAASSTVSYVIVQPSHQCEVDWAAWMSRTNGRLVWSFVRYDGIGLEESWNPVLPVEWRKARISP